MYFYINYLKYFYLKFILINDSKIIIEKIIDKNILIFNINFTLHKSNIFLIFNILYIFNNELCKDFNT